MFKTVVVKNKFTIYILISAIVGGLIGEILGVAYKRENPILFIIIGAFVGVFAYKNYKKRFKRMANSGNMQLREEILDISKRKKKTGEVNLYKKVINEEKTIVVPTTREQLVVEKKTFDDKNEGKIEIFNIPINEEQIEVKKHSVTTADIDIYSQKTTENKHIRETLKKEKELN